MHTTPIRLGRDTRIHDPTRFEFQHYKDIPSPKQPVISNGKVASPHGTGMILHESTPGLARRTRFPFFRYIFLNGSFAHC